MRTFTGDSFFYHNNTQAGVYVSILICGHSPVVYIRTVVTVYSYKYTELFEAWVLPLASKRPSTFANAHNNLSTKR